MLVFRSSHKDRINWKTQSDLPGMAAKERKERKGLMTLDCDQREPAQTESDNHVRGVAALMARAASFSLPN